MVFPATSVPILYEFDYTANQVVQPITPANEMIFSCRFYETMRKIILLAV